MDKFYSLFEPIKSEKLRFWVSSFQCWAGLFGYQEFSIIPDILPT